MQYLSFLNNQQILKTKKTVFFDGGVFPDQSGSARVGMSPGFNKFPIYDVASNTYPDKFNSNNYTFEIPVTGIYLIYSKVRPIDNTSTRSYGQGVHISENDGAWFIWNNTLSGADANRNGLQNTRIAKFNNGDLLRLYTYVGQYTEFSAAALQIYLLEEI